MTRESDQEYLDDAHDPEPPVMPGKVVGTFRGSFEPAPPPENHPNTGNRDSDIELATQYACTQYSSVEAGVEWSIAKLGALWGLRTSRAELVAEAKRGEECRQFIVGLLEAIPETFAFMHLRHKIESFLVGAGHREGE